MADEKNQPPQEAITADKIEAEDPHKVEKQTKLGHDRDPDEGSE